MRRTFFKTISFVAFAYATVGYTQDMITIREVKEGTNIDYEIRFVPEPTKEAEEGRKAWNETITRLEREQRELEERNAREYEPELRSYETNAPTLGRQLVKLVRTGRINAAREKVDEIVQYAPDIRMMRKKNLKYYPRSKTAMTRESIIHIRILWCFYQSIQSAETMDMEQAAENIIEEKSFDDWSVVEKDEKKRKAMRLMLAKCRAHEKRRELVDDLKNQYEKLEDEIVYRLDSDRQENDMADYNLFADEIRRVMTDRQLVERLLRADKVTKYHRLKMWSEEKNAEYLRSLKEGHKRVQAWLKQQREEQIRQQRERNREIMEEERQPSKQKGGGK